MPLHSHGGYGGGQNQSPGGRPEELGAANGRLLRLPIRAAALVARARGYARG